MAALIDLIAGRVTAGERKDAGVEIRAMEITT
jgi:hypothetical protein